MAASGERQKFIGRFEEQLDAGGYSRFMVPDEATYDSMVVYLSPGAPKNQRSLYYVKDRFEVIDAGGIKKVIKLRKDQDEPVKYLLKKKEIFDVLMDAHLSTGHGGEKKLRFHLATKYYNVTQKMIAKFVSNCETCQRKRTKPNKGLVVRPLKSKDVCERGQVDLIVMESTPDRRYKYILNYQDHFTKMVFLRGMFSKTAAETAYNLIDIFCTVSPPAVLQSDNGREFVAAVIDELKKMWPTLNIVHGTPRHPQSQGSVERANADVKQMLIAWTIDNETSQWAEGLRFVMLQKNCSPHRNLNFRTPLEIFCGRKGSSGLERTSLPDDVILMEREEDLMEALGRMKIVPERDDTDGIPESAGTAEIDNTDSIPEAAGGPEIDEDDAEIETTLSFVDKNSDSENSETQDEVELDKHMKVLRRCRQEAASGQEKSRAEMLKTTTEKLKPLVKDDAVLVPVSEFDRGRLDCRNVPGVILEVQHDMYRVGTVHGIVSTMLSRNQLMKASFDVVTPDMVNSEQVLPFRRIAAQHSKHGGQGFKKCGCRGKCMTSRCACFKTNNKCHSHCHTLNETCTNK